MLKEHLKVDFPITACFSPLILEQCAKANSCLLIKEQNVISY